MNPTYVPVPPISDKTRNHIYSLYLQDPEQWSPRALAESFGLSIVRIEAILRLKSMQEVMLSKGIQSQDEFVKGMEHMLGAVTLDPKKKQPAREPLRELIVKPNPFAQLIDEDEKLTPNDAATLLKLEPFQNIERRLDKRASQAFKIGETDQESVVLESNPKLKGKSDFIFVDVGENSSGVHVRAKDGTFREASKREIWNLKSKSKKMRV